MPGSVQVAIVGGGIGGLTAALALRARGLDVTVFEQAEVLREIGAGLSIHPNAARLLKRIGLDDQLRKIGSPIGAITLRISQGEAITRPSGPATPVFSRDGGQGYNVHLLASGAILSLGPYRYPPEGKTPAAAGRVVDAPATGPA